MNIDEQIKSLQRIKTTIELYKKLGDNISSEKASKNPEHLALEKDHPKLLEQFCSEVIAFCELRISQLTNPKAAQVHAQTVAIVSGTTPTPTPAPAPSTPLVTPENTEESLDPIRFLTKYRRLDGKKVSFQTKDGLILGTVRGVRPPNLVVETDSGYEITIAPKEITVLDHVESNDQKGK